MKKSLKKTLVLIITATTLLSVFSIGASAEWKSDSNGYWYTEGNSWSVGWRQIDGKWYYFESNGYMAHDTIIDGYALGSDGAWVIVPPTSSTTITTNNDSYIENKNESNFSTNETSSLDSVTIYYDDDYNMLDIASGVNTNIETDGVKYKCFVVNASDYGMSQKEFVLKARKLYKITNDNGTVKLVRK